MSNNGKPGLGASLIVAFVTGLLAASAYVTFRHGFSGDELVNFNVFAFWYVTPMHRGYVAREFVICLIVVTSTVALVMLIQLSLKLRNREHHGTARWSSFESLARAGYIRRFSQITGPIFGKTTSPFWYGRYLTNGPQPHSLVVAPTRAGKGVGIVIPTLLTFKGSVIALDVKGELFELTSRARRDRGNAIFKFAPLDPDRRTHCYNPVLDIIAMPPDRHFTEARRLAANLISAKSKSAESFLAGARDLFVAGVLACIEQGTPTIGAVYQLFSQPGEKYKLFARLAEETKNIEAQRIFDNMAGNDTKILTSYTSVLGDGGLNLWADPLVRYATSRSDFSIYTLRRSPSCIYLCVNPNDLEILSPLMRLIFQQIVSVLQRSLPVRDEVNDVLFLMDEFKHLGKLETISTAITTIAGYRGRFMIIVQSLSALTGAYEETGKQNFLGNAGIQVFMATGDDETPNYISKAIGDYTYRARSTSYQQSKLFDTNVQHSEQGAPLLRPEQVRLLDDDTQVVLIKGQPPVLMPKVKYYADRRLKRIFLSQAGPLPEPIPSSPSADATDVVVSLPTSATASPSVTRPMRAESEEVLSAPVAHQSDYETSDIGNGQDLSAPEPDDEVENDNPAAIAQRALLDQIIALQKKRSSRF
ncbi:type IV secretion system ATPase VirD4 [Rhizobium skierniewicense]|uniref:type IV secretion system ATPase VirD4 n=1 Tax=Rhizobium skierniewicense TaxID=984260 RepID=UPI001FAE2373|nr:type IV secretion system ATPase VirD4 [Rhizobium skierniewicense]MCI9868559.1 type IV secretion system ATPase VirD4 [Rhizobium skierniewicense]